MVSVRKRNIHGRCNSVRRLQRRASASSIVDSFVTSSVSISLENIRAKLKVTNRVPALSSHNSVTVIRRSQIARYR